MRPFSIIFAAWTLVSVPSLALAAPQNFQELANLIVTIMDNATIVLIVLGIVVYFWGISTSLFKVNAGGAAAKKTLTAYIIWGMIVLFVMVSIWGILQLLQNTLFSTDAVSFGVGNTSGGTASGGGFSPPPFSE
jgi:hypothetical protein